MSSPSGLPRGRRIPAIASRLALVLVLLALGAAEARAHISLRRSEPEKGAHLSVVPRELRLVFSAAPELAFTRLYLIGAAGDTIALSAPRLDSARIVVAAIEGVMRGGVYMVAWQVAGADGHPIRGRFEFIVAPGAIGAVDAEAATATPADPDSIPGELHHDPVSFPEGAGFGAQSPLYVAIRWAMFTALLIVLGAVAFRVVVLPVLARRDAGAASSLGRPMAGRAASVGLIAAVALTILVIVRLLAQSLAMHGASDILDGGLIGSMLTRTTWGAGWIVQAAGSVLAIAGFAIARRDRSTGWGLAALAALLLVVAPAISGHAAAVESLTTLAVGVDALHILGAGGWLGSLLVVLIVGVPVALRSGDGVRPVADLVNAFSPIALGFAALTALTGIINAWMHLPAIGDLWQSPYGRILLLKLSLLIAVIGTGAYNWRRARPALNDVIGVRRIRRSAGVELAAGLAVLLVTAVLVATPTPIDHPPVAASGTETR